MGCCEDPWGLCIQSTCHNAGAPWMVAVSAWPGREMQWGDQDAVRRETKGAVECHRKQEGDSVDCCTSMKGYVERGVSKARLVEVCGEGRHTVGVCRLWQPVLCSSRAVQRCFPSPPHLFQEHSPGICCGHRSGIGATCETSPPPWDVYGQREDSTWVEEGLEPRHRSGEPAGVKGRIIWYRLLL